MVLQCFFHAIFVDQPVEGEAKRRCFCSLTSMHPIEQNAPLETFTGVYSQPTSAHATQQQFPFHTSYSLSVTSRSDAMLTTGHQAFLVFDEPGGSSARSLPRSNAMHCIGCFSTAWSLTLSQHTPRNGARTLLLVFRDIYLYLQHAFIFNG